jgi:hypothetical protein
MKRAEAEVIGSPLFQFHKSSNNINDVKTAKYLLYGIWGNQICCSIANIGIDTQMMKSLTEEYEIYATFLKRIKLCSFFSVSCF